MPDFTSRKDRMLYRIARLQELVELLPDNVINHVWIDAKACRNEISKGLFVELRVSCDGGSEIEAAAEKLGLVAQLEDGPSKYSFWLSIIGEDFEISQLMIKPR